MVSSLHPRFASLGLSLGLALPLMACASDPGAGAEAAASSETGSEVGSEVGTETGGDEEPCVAENPTELAACVEQDRYVADLEFIAQPRDPGTAHWQAVQDLCVARFTEYGFEVELQTYTSGVNVIGRKPGTTAPDEQILLAAHYDHIPGCNGADDNASGTAAVLEAARVLSQVEFSRTLVVACWDEEELGLKGAAAYAARATGASDQILFNYNYEMIGYFDSATDSQTVPEGIELVFPEPYETLTQWGFTGDWIGLIVDESGLEHAQYMAAHADALGLKNLILEVPNDLKNSPLLRDLQRSDHAAFWAVDYPAMMITDTSEFRYANYHCGTGEDAVEFLDHDFAHKVIAASVGAASESLGGF